MKFYKNTLPMITNVSIENFKSIKSLTYNPSSLNLFMGLNGMGKSTVIQAFLLLRQSKKFELSKLSLNGDLVEIGRGGDALYNFSDREEVHFKLDFIGDKVNNKVSLDVRYTYDKDSDVLNLAEDKIDAEIFDIPLFTDEFVFLSAERISPSTAYEMSYDKVVNNHTIGIHGELAAHFLSLYGDTLTVPDQLCLKTSSSNKLSDQVQEWMNEISPGIKISTKELSEIDKVVISYGFQTDTISTNNFRPTNVGFGISYVLPVVIACLSSVHKMIIIENPEAHLHPRGQAKMGELIAKCATAGAQLFIETHSDHIVNGIRVAVKDKSIHPNQVSINYFTKNVEEGQSFTVNQPIRIGVNGELSNYPKNFIDEWENQLMKLI